MLMQSLALLCTRRTVSIASSFPSFVLRKKNARRRSIGHYAHISAQVSQPHRASRHYVHNTCRDEGGWKPGRPWRRILCCDVVAPQCSRKLPWARASAARCGEEIWGSDGRPSRRGWPGGTNRAHSSADGKLDSSFQCSLLLHSSASRPSMPRSGGRRRRPSASLIG